MYIFIVFFSILIALYFCVTLLLLLAWWRIPYYKASKQTQDNLAKISVIIPVRNEAQNIDFLLKDLSLQSYQNFEVFIINDHSTDETVQIIKNFIKNNILNIQLLHLEKDYPSPKKMAITQACQNASGELIVTTDGDCRVKKDWLLNFACFFKEKQAKFISAGVTFYQEKNTFEKMQSIEFGSLIASGAATLSLGFPTMANGANMAYPLKVFKEVKGYEGVEHIASGDDEFLLHKIAKKYPTQVFFLKNKSSIVYTLAKQSLKDFEAQRVRWASKWSYYQSPFPKIFAIFIFFCNFGLVFSGILLISGNYPPKVWLIQIFLKYFIEYFFLQKILSFLNKKKYSLYIFPLQILYPFYVFWIGIKAQKRAYYWKGRHFSK